MKRTVWEKVVSTLMAFVLATGACVAPSIAFADALGTASDSGATGKTEVVEAVVEDDAAPVEGVDVGGADAHSSCLSHSKSGWCIDENGHCEIPAGTTCIEPDEFFENAKLKSVAIPDGVTTIGDQAFQYCSRLVSVDIPNGVTSIGVNAFAECYDLTSVTLPASVRSIGEGAFGSCLSLESANIPQGVTTIEPGTFEGTSLKSIVILEGVTSIGRRAFFSCRYLSEVTIPSTVEYIGARAFVYTGIRYYDQVKGLIPSQLDALAKGYGDVNDPSYHNDEAFWQLQERTISWTVIVDGDESAIDMPYGEIPQEGTDFTVPKRDGYTPKVEIDENAHKVIVTYAKDADSEPEPVAPIAPADSDNGGKDDGPVDIGDDPTDDKDAASDGASDKDKAPDKVPGASKAPSDSAKTTDGQSFQEGDSLLARTGDDALAFAVMLSSVAAFVLVMLRTGRKRNFDK